MQQNVSYLYDLFEAYDQCVPCKTWRSLPGYLGKDLEEATEECGQAASFAVEKDKQF